MATRRTNHRRHGARPLPLAPQPGDPARSTPGQVERPPTYSAPTPRETPRPAITHPHPTRPTSACHTSHSKRHSLNGTPHQWYTCPPTVTPPTATHSHEHTPTALTTSPTKPKQTDRGTTPCPTRSRRWMGCDCSSVRVSRFSVLPFVASNVHPETGVVPKRE